MAGETNPGVQAATSAPGMSSALGIEQEIPEVNVTGGISDTSSSTTPQAGIDLSQFNPQVDSSVGNVDPSAYGLTSSASDALSSLSGGSALSSVLNSLGINSSNLGALAPELAVAGVGLAQAKSAQNDAAQQAASLKAPSENLLNAGNSLLSQFQSQQLTPSQQQFVDFTSTEGQAIIDSGAGLQAIATQAFGNYASGQLPQADEMQLQQQVSSQKQQIAQQLGSSGMQDSSVLAAYNQQIDNQAMVTRQNLLDARFQTGVTAYNTWLNSTTQGIQVKQAGAQFAQSSFQDMMNDSLQLESAGMSGLTQSIALTIQSDDQLSQSVSQLMGNLAAAYAYTVSGPGRGATGGTASGAAAGGATGILGSVLSKGVSSAVNNGISSIFGSGAAPGSASSILAGGSPTLSSVGTDAVGGAVDDSAGDIASALGGSAAGGEAATAGSAAGIGAGAPGVFASGDAAAGSAGTAASTGAIGAAAGVGAVAGAAAIPFLIGASGDQANEDGNRAMGAWMQATGVTYKPSATNTNSGQNTFGTQNAGKSSVSPGMFIGANGQPMTEKQAETQMVLWAQANGIPTGNLDYTGG